MGSASIDNNGFRRQWANPISKVGVFPYRGDEIDYDGEYKLEKDKFYWVLRGPNELFAPEAIETFNGLPIRCGHLMLGKKPANMKENEKTKDLYKSIEGENYADGCIYNVRPSLDNPGFLIAEFTIWTDRLQEILAAGRIKELSLGYTCQWVKEDGVFNGQPYQFKQINLKGNHLALVKHGRCGSSVCVCDSAPDGAPVVVTFDSLPEGMNPMAEPKKDDKCCRAKELAAKIKGGDEQLALDCLDFADCSPEERKAFLDSRKSKKNAAGKEEQPAKDEQPPVPPTPPEVDKKDESAAPAAAATSAPATGEDVPATQPPESVPSPKDGENPATDCNPVKDCGAAPATDCGAAPVKDGEVPPAQPVTEPTAQVPVSAISQIEGEEKKEEPAAPATDAIPKTDDKPHAEGCTCDECKAKKEAEKKAAAEPEKKDEPAKKEGFAQDEYAAFAVEYANAQRLADSVRPLISVAMDSTTMREIDVARFAVKNIPSLAFVMDSASDEVVLAAVRGHVAALAAKPAAPVTDAAPVNAPEKPVETPKTEVPVQDSAVFEDVIPPATPATPAKAADAKALADYMSGIR